MLIRGIVASAVVFQVIVTALGYSGGEVETTTVAQVGPYADPVLNLFYEPGLSVGQIVELQGSTWHWHPWKKLVVDATTERDDLAGRECLTQDSIDELPADLFTQKERLNGAIILHFIGAIYSFTLLAVICNDYFLPAVECICEGLQISEDVAAATFMSIASSTPEFYTNLISTFIAESDMGLGTIIGSMLFNTLGVAACAGLASIKPVQLNWFPLTRDSLIFFINVSVLVCMTWDGVIMWYETSVLFAMLILYFVVLFKNERIEKRVRYYVETKWQWIKPEVKDMDSEKTVSTQSSVVVYPVKGDHTSNNHNNKKESPVKSDQLKEKSVPIEGEPKVRKSLWRLPDDTLIKQAWWIYKWPIKLVLTLLIPDPKTYRNWYPLTFVLCMAAIGFNSYIIYWMVAIIGHTFEIPESVMGLTFLAWGGCLPEAISCVIIIRKGRGGFGVSNSLGANSLNILMSLGLPWFIKTMVAGAGTTAAYVKIVSYGIEFTISSILLAGLALYVIVTIAGYRLKKTVGLILICVYLVFITFAVFVEMDILFPSGNYC